MNPYHRPKWQRHVDSIPKRVFDFSMLVEKTLTISVKNLPLSRQNMMIIVYDELDSTSGSRFPVKSGPVKTGNAEFIVSENHSTNSLQISVSQVSQES